MRLMRVFLALLIAALPMAVAAQQPVIQGGAATAGHTLMYRNSGSGQVIAIDSGPAGGNSVGQGLSELNITARGTGTAPYDGQGTGPNGEIFCMQDAPATNATGYHSLCMSANVGAKGYISYQPNGAAAQQDLIFNVNGTEYTFPFTGGSVIGPGLSAVNNVACWNNLVGTLLKDCGTFPSIGGVNGQIQYNNAGAFGGFTLGGDGTVNTGTGVLTITKINTVNITLGGTMLTGGALTTANAFTTAGNFPLTLTQTATTNVTLPTTGTLATLAGTEALTNKSVNGITLAGTGGSTIDVGTGGSAITKVYSQTFTASGTYTPHAGIIYAILECWGGGGGGGGTATAGAGASSGAAGGGAGGYSRRVVTAAQIGASQVVTIGAAGSGAGASNSSGGAGGATSVGTLCVANGGAGGGGSSGASISTGGTGGVAGTGDIAAVGMNGMRSTGTAALTADTAILVGGMGASCALGSGGAGSFSGAGSAATGRCAGGGGGGSVNSSGAAAGGAGTAGFIAITEFANQ